MEGQNWLAQQFEKNRTHLKKVAYRILGSITDAEDAVQEVWLKLSGSDADGIQNLGGWLTAVVARVCLDMLRSRKSRREELLEQDSASLSVNNIDPEEETILAEAMGPALIVVLEALAPAERVAFVLHDMFAVPFEEVAQIVGRSTEATRQLASRARRRVRGAPREPGGNPADHRKIVDAFLKASRQGDFEALLQLLDPDVALHADAFAVLIGAPADFYGAQAVAGFFKGRAAEALPAWVGEAAGAVWAPSGKPRVAFSFVIKGGKITRIELVADHDSLCQLNVKILSPQESQSAL